MKNRSFTFLALAGFGILMTITYSACKKDPGGSDNNTVDNRSKTEILISGTGKWYFSSWIDKPSGESSIELVDRTQTCEKDNGMVFAATSNTATKGDVTWINPVKCKSNEINDGTKDGFGWYFYNTEQTIINFSAINYNVVKWTKDEIKLYKAIENGIVGDSDRNWITWKPLP